MDLGGFFPYNFETQIAWTSKTSDDFIFRFEMEGLAIAW